MCNKYDIPLFQENKDPEPNRFVRPAGSKLRAPKVFSSSTSSGSGTVRNEPYKRLPDNSSKMFRSLSGVHQVEELKPEQKRARLDDEQQRMIK